MSWLFEKIIIDTFVLHHWQQNDTNWHQKFASNVLIKLICGSSSIYSFILFFSFLDAVIKVYKTSMTVQTFIMIIFVMSRFWKSLFVVYNRKTRIHKSLPSRWNQTVTIPCHWLTLCVDTFLICTQENFSHGWVNQVFFLVDVFSTSIPNPMHQKYSSKLSNGMHRTEWFGIN